MNPTGTIEVGVTRLPHVAGPAAGPDTAPGLDAAVLADPDTLRALVGHWSMDELYTVGNLLMGEGERLGAAELVEILRWLFLPAPDATGPDLSDVPKEPQDAAVVKVEFVTGSPYEDGVFWADEEIYLHHDNGHVSESEVGPPEGVSDDDPFYAEWEEKIRRYEDLLADYARANPPNAGDHLIVDLTTGEFDQSGRWSLP
ncbi:hypothetical protein PL81_14625 [Streptomyces sp. RSD-27]|nr:hypothetical protein PL81_14625 [Streptomyces sp. RSD-27]